MFFLIYTSLGSEVESWVNTNFLPFIVLSMVAILHILFSALIQTKVLKSKEKRFRQALWTLLMPPLFLDWDDLYRENEGRMGVRECWVRTKRSIMAHNIITFLGNVAILASVLYNVEHSTQKLPNHWPLTPWLPVSIFASFLIQIIQIGLGNLYFKSCHPWSRLLKGELALAKSDNTRSCS